MAFPVVRVCVAVGGLVRGQRLLLLFDACASLRVPLHEVVVFTVLTGLKNVCARARFHGSRWHQKPGHHTKPRKNGGIFKKFRVAPGLW